MKQTNKLATLLSLAGLDGSVAIAAISGLFTAENALTLAVVFMAGPTAILTAILLEGGVRERMFAALLAGAIATIIVVLAAGLGPRLLSILNLNVLKIVGGIAVLIIGLIIMGVKIPEKAPMLVMFLGLMASFVWR